MKVMVTGGAGYIGSVLVFQLLQRGHSVRVVDTYQFGKEHLGGDSTIGRELFKWPPPASRFLHLVTGDIREPDAGWFEGIEAVAHLAGFSNDPMADADPALNHEINVTGTRRIAEAAIAAGIERFIFGSSASIYDRGKLVLGPEEVETAPVDPIGGYSTSKYNAERILLKLADETEDKDTWFRPVIFRQGTVFGQSPRMRYDLVVNQMVRDAVMKRVVQVHGEEMLFRPLIGVEAVARLHVQALEAEHELPRVLNAVGVNYSVSDLAMRVAGITGAIAHVVQMPEGRRVRNYRCSMRATDLAFGDASAFEPLTESIRQMAASMPEDPYDAQYENIATMRKAGLLA